MSKIQTIQKKELVELFLENKFRNTESYKTKTDYENGVKRFGNFLKLEKNWTIQQAKFQLVEQKSEDPINVLDEYYTHLRNSRFGKKQKKYSNSAVRTYLIMAKELLRFMGLKVYNEDVKQKFKLPPKQETSEPGLEKSTVSRVLRNSPFKLQTAILCCCSSGVRIGEFVQLQVGDFDFSSKPTTVTLRAEIVKGKIHPRKTHLTLEATNALKDYLVRNGIDYNNPTHQEKFPFLQTHEERINDYKRRISELDLKISKNEKVKGCNPIAIRTTHLKKIQLLEKQRKESSSDKLYYKSIIASENALRQMLTRVLDSIPDLSKRHEHNVRDIHFHSFRYFFKTQVTDGLNSDFAESLMGHKNLKLTYYKKNDRKRMESYRQCEPSLTIADFEKVERDLENIQEKHLEYEHRFRKYEKLDRLLGKENFDKLIKHLDSLP